MQFTIYLSTSAPIRAESKDKTALLGKGLIYNIISTA